MAWAEWEIFGRGKCGSEGISLPAGAPTETESQVLTILTKAKMKRLVTLTIAIVAIPALSAVAADGKAVYEKDCAKCHGPDGKGQTAMGKRSGAKDYTDPKVQSELKDEAAIKAVKEGYKNKEGKVVMKPAEGLSDDEVKAVVAYMRTFKK